MASSCPQLVIAVMISLACWAIAGCDQQPPLAGQANSTLTFFGLAVDQNGQPLPDAQFTVDVEAFPANWTFDTRDKPHLHSTVAAKSGPDGRFQFDVTGHILRFTDVKRTGYRHLYDMQIGRSHAIDNMAYRLNAWGDLWYKSDPANPAIYVFVREGVREASTFPSRGGSNSGNGTQWTTNAPGWPTQPSLPDVNQKGAQPRVNTKVSLAIKAIDSEGRPMANVLIWVDVERYRSLKEMAEDHNYNTRRTEVPRVTTQTGADGMAAITIDGFRIIAIDAMVKGARSTDGPFPVSSKDEKFYARELMDASGKPIYRCDAVNPIVIVMWSKDEPFCHVLPCAGGYELRDEKWIAVQPRWMENPRGGVRYSPPSTTQNSSR